MKPRLPKTNAKRLKRIKKDYLTPADTEKEYQRKVDIGEAKFHIVTTLRDRSFYSVKIRELNKEYPTDKDKQDCLYKFYLDIYTEGKKECQVKLRHWAEVHESLFYEDEDIDNSWVGWHI